MSHLSEPKTGNECGPLVGQRRREITPCGPFHRLQSCCLGACRAETVQLALGKNEPAALSRGSGGGVDGEFGRCGQEPCDSPRERHGLSVLRVPATPGVAAELGKNAYSSIRASLVPFTAGK